MPSRSPSQPEQVTYLGPRVLLVASVSDRVRQPNLDLTLQAGKQVHRDRGVTEPVQPAKRGQRGDGFIDNGLAELVGTRADVVSSVRCCHSRTMPDTTAAVTRPDREHPQSAGSQGPTPAPCSPQSATTRDPPPPPPALPPPPGAARPAPKTLNDPRPAPKPGSASVPPGKKLRKTGGPKH